MDAVLERYVFIEVFLRRGSGRPRRGTRGIGAGSKGTGSFPATLAATGSAAFAATAAEELEVLEDDLHAAALFLGGLVFPLVEAQTAFHVKWTALAADGAFNGAAPTKLCVY